MAKEDKSKSNGHIDLDLTAYMPDVRTIKVKDQVYAVAADVAPSLTIRIQKWFEQLAAVQNGAEAPETFDEDLFTIAAALLKAPRRDIAMLGYDGAFAVVSYFLGEVSKRRLATTSSEAPLPSL